MLNGQKPSKIKAQNLGFYYLQYNIYCKCYKFKQLYYSLKSYFFTSLLVNAFKTYKIKGNKQDKIKITYGIQSN